MSQKIAFKLHAYISLAIFIPLVIVCLSGSLLVYKDELNSIFDSKTTDIVVVQGLDRMSFDRLRDVIDSRYPSYEIVGWNIDVNPKKADKIWLMKHGGNEWEFVYLDAFSAELKGELTAHDKGFWGVLAHIHEGFLLEKGGQIFIGIVGILTLLVSITGFIIYRNFWVNLFRLRFKKLAVFMSDMHKFIGVFATPILFAVSISGAWWELRGIFMPDFDNSDFVINEKIYNKNLSIDDLIKRSKVDLIGFKPHYISFPFFSGADIRIFGYKNDQSFLYNQYSSQVSYNAQDGSLSKIRDIAKANFLDKFLETFRRAHFGNYNSATKILWFVIGIMPLLLSISGIYLWVKRNKIKRRKIEK